MTPGWRPGAPIPSQPLRPAPLISVRARSSEWVCACSARHDPAREQLDGYARVGQELNQSQKATLSLGSHAEPASPFTVTMATEL